MGLLLLLEIKPSEGCLKATFLVWSFLALFPFWLPRMNTMRNISMILRQCFKSMISIECSQLYLPSELLGQVNFFNPPEQECNRNLLTNAIRPMNPYFQGKIRSSRGLLTRSENVKQDFQVFQWASENGWSLLIWVRLRLRTRYSLGVCFSGTHPGSLHFSVSHLCF